jgi:hypothetical protein
MFRKSLLACCCLFLQYRSASAFRGRFLAKRYATAADSTVLQATKERRPWDFVRFVTQSSKFVSIFPTRTPTRMVKPGRVLWDPKGDGENDFTLAPLDDVVMGGASSSTFSFGRWKGTVTDANNGGFIGIRSTPSFLFDMSACEGIEIKLTSDDTQRRFKFGLRDSKEFNGIVWTASVDVKGSKAVRVNFNKLVPTLFARTVPNSPTFKKDNVVGLQLIYSKFEYDGEMNPNFTLGDIDVAVSEIKAF